MHPKEKITAATTAAQNAAAAAQDAAAAAQQSLNAAAHDAAAAATEAALQFKSNIRDYIPGMHREKPMSMPEKAKMLTFLGLPYMAVSIALIIVLLSAFIFMRRRQGMRPLRRFMQWFKMRRLGKSTVLICGPVDSGKTALFHTLSCGEIQPTETSMQEKTDTFKIHPKILGTRKDKLCDINFEFIDYPGHPSKELHLGRFFNQVQGLILVVDASSNDSIMQASKTFYSLLEKKGFLHKKIPVMICANKIDMIDSLSLNAIRGKMLDEINKMRDSRSTTETTSEKVEDITSAGKSGEKFTWENLGMTVSFGQISAKQANVTDVLDFLEGIHH
jgi:small GTP-binding protein